MRVKYEDIKITKRISHYDVTWKGMCMYKRKRYFFTTTDETQYELLEAMCPCCMEGGSNDYCECNCCVAYETLWCTLVEASLFEILKGDF